MSQAHPHSEWGRIQAKAARILGVDAAEIQKDTDFAQLDADSMELFALVAEIQEDFGLELSQEALLGLETVGDLLERIQNT